MAGSEKRAALAALRHRLEVEPSVTAVLEDWCLARGIGEGALRSLQLGTVAAAPDTARLCDALGAEAAEVVLHRRIRLMRGTVPLLWADNWYRPALLSAPMRAAFEDGETPFGPAIAALSPIRRLLSSTTAGGEDGVVLRLEAALVLPSGAAVSVVRERLLDTLLPA
ncbi:MAG: hypothetical protein AAFQ88_14870 [Pseudomonadota bacterium]